MGSIPLEQTLNKLTLKDHKNNPISSGISKNVVFLSCQNYLRIHISGVKIWTKFSTYSVIIFHLEYNHILFRSKSRSTNKCRKLCQRSKTNIKISLNCRVSWNTSDDQKLFFHFVALFNNSSINPKFCIKQTV